MSTPSRPLVSFKDIATSLVLVCTGALATIFPVVWWRGICDGLATMATLLPIARYRGNADQLRAAFPDNDELRNPRDTLRSSLSMYLQVRMQIVDQNVLRKWHPEIEVRGSQHIDDGFRAGHGVLVWFAPFAFSDLVTKMGLAQAGYSVYQLSRPTHGFSDTRFGIAVLNRLRTRVEDRYLGGRVLVDYGTAKQAILRMHELLYQNCLVSIRAGAQSNRPATVPLGSGVLHLATGAVRIAQDTGAALLPVFTIAESAQRFVLSVEAPLSPSDNDTCAMLLSFAQLTAMYGADAPIQWRGIQDFSTDPDH